MKVRTSLKRIVFEIDFFGEVNLGAFLDRNHLCDHQKNDEESVLFVGW
jgi:hypothetical protein